MAIGQSAAGRITNHWADLLGRAIGRYPHSTTDTCHLAQLELG
jgi:hypothetical protein